MLSLAGKDLALYDGFTYFCVRRNKKTDFWYCTKSGSNVFCKAGLIVSKNKELIGTNGSEHNHSPPQFIIRQGVLIKL